MIIGEERFKMLVERVEYLEKQQRSHRDDIQTLKFESLYRTPIQHVKPTQRT